MSEKTKPGISQSVEDYESGDGPLTRRFTYSQWPNKVENADAGSETVVLLRNQIIQRLESVRDQLKPEPGTQAAVDEYETVISQLQLNPAPLEEGQKMNESEE